MKNKSKYEQYSTYIRHIYSPGYSCIILSFYKHNLSFLFQPYIGTDNNGLHKYDKQGIMTTTDHKTAAALFYVIRELLHGGKLSEGGTFSIPCGGSSTLALERRIGQNGQPETFLTVTKNGNSISFKFAVVQCKVAKNGQVTTEEIEGELMAFCDMLHGYLREVNAGAHLNKLLWGGETGLNVENNLDSLQVDWRQAGQQQPAEHQRPWNNNQSYTNNRSYSNNQYSNTYQ